ncbi:gamma-glutamyltranspeptidase family protein [Penicillium sp. IBT 16267x]|nr:gamma-glutamyltranspeptidase family protein [Penicillium sp. IBT 16267x]
MSLRFTRRNSQSVDIWEHPPNGQNYSTHGPWDNPRARANRAIYGIPPHNSAEYLHLLIEVLRIAFADGTWWISNPDINTTPNLLSPSYLAERALLYNPNRASSVLDHGSPALRSSDTVYFAVTDASGNAASVVNGNYHGFGSGIIPADCGFTLQSRGANFSLEPGHPNALEPGKRPYHTIIPAMATNPDGSFHSAFGVIGGFMQPQGHVQALMNMLVFGMGPQEALDAPRVCLGVESSGGSEGWSVDVEEGISSESIDALAKRGYRIKVRTGWQRDLFGRGQTIRSRMEDGQRVYSAGSDPRGDGMAVPV